MFYIKTFDTLDSTNDECKQHYHKYQDRSVIIAKRQTKGRGRFDRVWESEKDLTFSILYKKDLPFPLIFPLAVVHACKRVNKVAMIKWPNDILIDEKKVCGILIERIYEGANVAAMVAGIGINLSEKSDVLQQKATYVKEDAKQLLTIVLEELACLEKKSKQQLLKEYQSYHLLYKKDLVLDDVCYQVQEVQLDGSLKVESKEGVRYLYGEEVTLEQMYKEDL